MITTRDSAVGVQERPEAAGRLRGRLAPAALLAVTLGWACAASAQTAPATASAPAEAAAPPDVSDSDVKAAIAKGVKFLYSRQDAGGGLPSQFGAEYVGGAEALAALALLKTGQSPRDRRMARLLHYLAGQNPGHTYTRSLRTMVFSLLPGEDSRKLLAEDARWLVRQQQPSGGWGYGPASEMARIRPEWTDASNSQFALLALREADDAGVSVPMQNWLRAENYWRRSQNGDGGWGYQTDTGEHAPQRAASHGSMTAAGAATYFVLADKIGPTRENAFAPGKSRSGGDVAFSREIHRALAWLSDNYAVDRNPKYVWMPQVAHLHYYLFCLQRVGASAGLASFGRNDHAAQTAGLLLARQKGDGSWGGSVIETSFALLCLAKARAPIVINRLDVDGGVQRDPRDAAHVARWLSRRLSVPLAWQQAPPGGRGAFGEAPLLYITAAGRIRLADDVAERFRRFIRNGGTCLVQAPAGQPNFVPAFQQYCLKLFGDYQKQEIGDDHPVFSVRFKIDPTLRPKMAGVGDGCRTRIFILAEDVSGAWHQGRFEEYPHLFELAGNLVFYATAGAMPPGRFAVRSARPAVPPVRKRIRLARLRHSGDYQVCPLAVPRLSEVLAYSLSIGLEELPPVEADKPIDAGIPLLWLTGNTPPSFSGRQLANLRDYVQSGGTLLIDPAIGGAEFRAAGLALLGRLFPPGAVKPLPADSPLMTGNFAGGIGADVRKVRLLPGPTTRPTTRPAAPKLWAATVNGRIAAVLSAHGLTCSVEGNPCWENAGYTTEDARRIALNVILYAAAGGR